MIAFRHLSLWLTLFAITASGLGVYLELTAKSLSQNNIRIEVLPTQSDFENVALNVKAIELNSELQKWFDENKSQDIKLILQDETYRNLSQSDKMAIAILLSRNYYEAKRYQSIVTLLETLSLEQRLKNELQFKFAFSQSRLQNQDSAITAYQHLIEYSPNAQSAHLNLALIYRRDKQCNLAELLYQQTVNISSGRVKAKALSGLADCQMQRNDYAAAESNYALAIQYEPTQADLWMDLAESQNALQQPYATIEKTLANASKLNANSASIQYKKAEIELANLDFLAAVDSAELSIKINPNSRAYRIKAWALIEMGKRNAASQAVNAALKLNPSESRAAELKAMQLYIKRQYTELTDDLENRKLTRTKRYLKALAYRRAGLFDKALDNFENVENSPDFYWRSNLHKTRIKRSRKQYDIAIDDFNRFIQHQPNAAFLHFEIALVSESLQRFAYALENINTAINKLPENRVYLLTKARLQFAANDSISALNEINTLIATYPRYSRAYLLKADILKDQSKTNADFISELASTYQAILTLNPEDIAIRYQLAVLLKDQRDHQAAVTQLNEILEISASYINARLLLAETYIAMEDNSQAVNELNLLLKLKPDHKEAQQLLFGLQQITQK